MSRRTIAAIIACALVVAPAAIAAESCTVVVNGRALKPGDALCDEAGNLLLSADALNRALGLTIVREGEGAPWAVRGYGQAVLVRPGARRFLVNEVERTAEACPVIRDEQIFVPLAMLADVFGIDATFERDGDATIWAVSTDGAMVTDIRDGRHGDRLRIVMDLSEPAGLAWWTDPGVITIEVPQPDDADALTPSVRLLGISDELGDQIRQGPTPDGSTRVEVLHSSTATPEVFTLSDPPRVVVDLPRAPEDVRVDQPVDQEPTPELEPLPESTRPLPVSAGVLETRNFSTSRGPVRVHVMDIDPRSTAIEVRPALASETVHKRASVAQMVSASGAWGGINGGFFSRSGPPLGMLVVDGEWVRDPWGGRTVLGITRTGELMMDRLDFAGRVLFAGFGWQKLAAVNRGHEEHDTLVLFNRWWGPYVEGAQHRTRLAVDASGNVIEKSTNGTAVAIPEGGFVLSGNGRMALSLDEIEVGCNVTAE
ncbi:MAG: AMIN domain-containing protein, partial [Armatimonadota bacterium]